MGRSCSAMARNWVYVSVALGVVSFALAEDACLPCSYHGMRSEALGKTTEDNLSTITSHSTPGATSTSGPIIEPQCMNESDELCADVSVCSIAFLSPRIQQRCPTLCKYDGCG
eukprot:m.15482 g.15482  ORF g.15482 m.15482 type:complete len:113 (-) comp5417_c0_seq1:1957-2295(-)